MTPEEAMAECEREAKVLDDNGHTAEARAMRRVLTAWRESCEDLIRWMPESTAVLRSKHSAEWWRARFAWLESQGLAKIIGRKRHYRASVVMPGSPKHLGPSD